MNNVWKLMMISFAVALCLKMTLPATVQASIPGRNALDISSQQHWVPIIAQDDDGSEPSCTDSDGDGECDVSTPQD